MVWLNRDPFALLRASNGHGGMLRVAEGLANPFTTAAALRRPTESGTPGAPTNVDVTEDAALVAMLLPGCGPDDIELSLHARTLRVRGSRAQGSFERSFRLPFPVSVDDAEARVEDGVLELLLERRADDRPTRVRIAGASPSTETIEAAPSEAEARTEVTATPDEASADVEVTPVEDDSPALPRLRPRLRALRSRDGLELTLEIPGADRPSITLEVEEGELHLSADASFPSLDAALGGSHREFPLGAGYEGRWALPDDVDTERAESSYERGLLSVRVPVRAAARRSIQVG